MVSCGALVNVMIRENGVACIDYTDCGQLVHLYQPSKMIFSLIIVIS